MLFLKRVWTWIKKYWQLMLLVLTVFVGLVFFRKQSSSFSDDYEKIKQAHDEELKKIEEARQEERLKTEENIRRLQTTLDQVQKQYDQNLLELDKAKKKQIEKIVKEYGNDSDALAKRLTEVTGFTIILPQD